uniref:Uncharacterized protein n=1 Tax=Triticum urartu TaxID=4572 RepID=A0A8R7PK31_TRIUA
MTRSPSLTATPTPPRLGADARLLHGHVEPEAPEPGAVKLRADKVVRSARPKANPCSGRHHQCHGAPLTGSSEFYHFHHAEDLLDQRFNSNSLVKDFPVTLDAAFPGPAKKPRRLSKAWTLWGFIHCRATGRRGSPSDAPDRAFSESWPKLRVRGVQQRRDAEVQQQHQRAKLVQQQQRRPGQLAALLRQRPRQRQAATGRPVRAGAEQRRSVLAGAPRRQRHDAVLPDPAAERQRPARRHRAAGQRRPASAVAVVREEHAPAVL